MSIYPQAITLARESCAQYREGLISEDVLQYRLMTAASLICALEEKKLRHYLEDAESYIDLARFTTRDVRNNVLNILDGVEKELEAWDS
jgi:hypothetical protein